MLQKKISSKDLSSPSRAAWRALLTSSKNSSEAKVQYEETNIRNRWISPKKKEER